MIKFFYKVYNSIHRFFKLLKKSIMIKSLHFPPVPEIHYDPILNQPLQLRTNSTLYIEVDVLGYPRPAVAWFHQDQLLEESARLTVEDNNGWSYLKMKNIAGKDTGSYRVTAVNTAGRDEAQFVVMVKGGHSI